MKKTTSVSINPNLIGKMKELVGMKSTNQAVEFAVRAVVDCRQIPQATIWDLTDFTKSMRKCKKTVVKVSLDEKVLSKLAEKYQKERSRSERVSQCLIQFLYVWQLDKLVRPIQLLGSKWHKEMQEEIKEVLDKQHYESVVETCAGALGIFSIVEDYDHYRLNDIDGLKICLYRQLQKKSSEFVLDFLRMPCDIEKCQRFKEELREFEQNASGNVNSAVQREVALKYLYVNYYMIDRVSAGESHLRKPPSLQYVVSLCKLAKKLKKVELSQKNLLSLVPQVNDANTLIICDPPYPFTAVYGDNLGLREHLQLAEKLQAHRGDFIYFCRTTERKNGTIEETPRLKAFLEDMFADCGCYYTDIKTKDGTERIITNFEFDGGQPFDIPTAPHQQESVADVMGGACHE